MSSEESEEESDDADSDSGDDSSHSDGLYDDEGRRRRPRIAGTEEHEAAFGEHTRIYDQLRDHIDMLRDNDPNLEDLSLNGYDEGGGSFNSARVLSEDAFELLGRYMAKHDYLQELVISRIAFSDSKGASLFRGLTRSKDMRNLYMFHCDIGINCVQSMVPFLQNSQVNQLCLQKCENIDTECFEVLAKAMAGGSVKKLSLFQCSIKGISSLENLTKLVELSLGCNDIGYAGCDIISKLLQNQECSLEMLDLQSTGIGREGVEKIADSLKGNKTLQSLCLIGNELSERACKIFLELLNDISSIENTIKSNSTLTHLRLPEYGYTSNIQQAANSIDKAVNMNDKSWKISGQAGREKVRQTQLNSEMRKNLCKYQGIDYSYGSVFSCIEPALLPNVMALVGGLHSQTDLYLMLLTTSSDLISLIDKKKMLRETMKAVKSQFNQLSWDYSNITFKFSKQSPALAAKFVELNDRLILAKSREDNAALNTVTSEPARAREKTMVKNTKQLSSDAVKFSLKVAAVMGGVETMMEDSCCDFPGLKGKKRKRSSSI